MTLVEIALDDVAGAWIAERAGADRIELCAGLTEGGTTPSIGLVSEAAGLLSSATMMVLIRPRAGDFVYTVDEVRVMRADIEAIRSVAPAAGFVIGALTADGEIDAPTVATLVSDCAGAPVTVNKAFDSTRDLARSLDTLIELGVDRVLTSGGRRSALDGADHIRQLVERAEDRIVVMAGGSVRAENVRPLIAATGVGEVHLRAAIRRASGSAWNNPEQDYADAVLTSTDGETVQAMVRALATEQS